MDTSQLAGMDSKKNSIDSMSKEELVNKYKGLLGIAKQAKKAKDEFAEENQKLKEKLTNCETQREADKQSLLTMKEMLEEFTRNKLEMTTEITELRGKNKSLIEERVTINNGIEKLSIENEALRRQLDRLTEDNESLLTDIDNMEQQLKQVNVLGIEQKKHLDLLELEVEKLKEYEVSSRELEIKLQDLLQANTSLQESFDSSQTESQTLADRYQNLKDINSEQRAKFNGLKDRFIEVHKKLKQLQDCKRILVESHHEYADSISRWQLEIMHASEKLCEHIHTLTKENTELKREIQTSSGEVGVALPQLPVLIDYCEKALVEYRRQNEVIEELRKENEELRSNVVVETPGTDEADCTKVEAAVVHGMLNEELPNTKNNSDEELKVLRAENSRLVEEIGNATLNAKEYHALREENERLSDEIAKIRISFSKEVEHLNANNAKLQTEAFNVKLQTEETIKHLMEDKEKWTNEAANATLYAYELEQLKAANERFELESKRTADDEVIGLKSENAKLREEAAMFKMSISEEVTQLRTDNIQLADELSNIKLKADAQMEQMKTTNDRLKEATNTQQTVLESEIHRLKESNQGLKDELLAVETANKTTTTVVMSYLPALIDCCERALVEHKQQSEVLMKENADAFVTDSEASFKKDVATLKTENNALKEKLSRAEIPDVLKLKTELQTTTELCEDLQVKLAKQERENTDLLNEMRELNEALKGRGDVISRQQAKHQELLTEIKKTTTALANIEADLNSKDTILKEREQKITKMSEDNHAALQEVNRLQNMCRDNESRIKTLSEEITAMRSQLENHDTQSEILSTSTISRAEELSRLREVDDSFEEKYNKLRSLAVKLKKKAHEQSLHIADLEKQAADSKTKATDTNDRLTTIEAERESLQKELKTSKNQIESLKADVDKLKSSKKQSNVLTLEIEAFEKSLNETSAKLTSKIAEYDLLRERLQTKESAIEVMKKEIRILEESQESEKTHSMELKKQIDKLQTQLKDAIHGKQELSEKLDESQTEKQILQADLDDVNKRLSSIADERDAERATLLKEKDTLVQTINSLEDELNASNNRITLAERSYLDLQDEYSKYKVKAQSVLRQNQTKESSKERELEEELTLLKSEHKELSARLQAFQEKFQANERTIEELQEDNARLQKRSSELMNTITDMRSHTDMLSHENKKQLETYQETLKGHRLQMEALDACHLEQMQDMQTKYDRQIADLKATHKKSSEAMPQKTIEKLDYILMEREDAEGSEAETANTPKYLPSSRRSTHDLIPLDELLSSPTVDSSYTTVLERRRSISPSIELQETKERLQKQESRVRHLTSLLAESEQDLARLTQLNEMLKEEVRRQERTMEREKHMHNSEYLKNVVLKFVSLNNGDERSRLVPVLNTILKLSPIETEMLLNVAKGKAPDNNNRSWGSFLPNWGTS